MEAGLNTEETLKYIFAKDARAAATYHALNDRNRGKVLAALDGKGLKILTRLVMKARSGVFREAEERIPEVAEGIVRTPVYLIDENLIEENMRVLRYVKDRTGCRILHALKAYASFATFGVMTPYLDGVCASGANEARLGREEFGKEVHTFGAAYGEKDIRAVLRYSDCVIFNSFHQLERFGKAARRLGRQVGLRVNPGHAEVETPMYNPCAPRSRLGVVHDEFERCFPAVAGQLQGLHFHAMCEQNSDVLERILTSFERLYGRYLKGLTWVNFGGGHHITRDDYDLERLIRLINNFKKKYGVQVYLEPGEASVYHAGMLISTVLDVVKNEMDIAIMDTSAETHMPDVLLMPYRPHVIGSAEPRVRKHTYRLAGPSCLAGDVVGDYSFDKPLRRGTRLLFADMALYSIVKSTTFNGIGLPDVAVLRKGGAVEVVRRFGYRAYRNRQS